MDGVLVQNKVISDAATGTRSSASCGVTSTTEHVLGYRETLQAGSASKRIVPPKGSGGGS